MYGLLYHKGKHITNQLTRTEYTSAFSRILWWFTQVRVAAGYQNVEAVGKPQICYISG